MADTKKAPLLDQKGDEPSELSFCGFICSRWIGWRGGGSNRLRWKALCSVLLASEIALLLRYSAVDPEEDFQLDPALCFIALFILVKFLVEIWGQDTPSWVCPGTLVMLFVIYGLIIPTCVFTYGYCNKSRDLAFLYHKEVGVFLFLFGSFYSLAYEVGRFRWKAKPEHKGVLHTVGLASWCIHPNYFGDLFAYSGWALAVGTSCSMSIPLAMVWSFAFVVNPNSDSYLASRYPEQFPDYAAKTATLIPFVVSRRANKALGVLGILASCFLGMQCGDACG